MLATDAVVAAGLPLPANLATRLHWLGDRWRPLCPWHRERLGSRPSPPSGPGVPLGAEPPLSFGRRDYSPVVPATAWHVVNAVTLGTDIAFDPASVGVVVDSGLGGQSLAPPPVPRRDELNGPDESLGDSWAGAGSPSSTNSCHGVTLRLQRNRAGRPEIGRRHQMVINGEQE